MEFKQIQENAIAEQAKRKAIEEKIEMRRKQIYRLEKKLDKQRAWWGDILIRPIMEAVKEKYPQLTWDDERLVPLGLRCAVSVFAHVGEDKYENCVASITFTPGDTEKGEIWFDTGEKRGNYPSGSLGDLNGLSNVTKKVESLEEIFNHIDKDLERNKEKLNQIK